jgi:hypothetical protein
MKHRATAACTLAAGMAASYAYYSAPPEHAAFVWHVTQSFFIVYLLAVLAMVHKSWEMWAVCVVLAFFRFMIIGCSTWFFLDPWPVKPGDALCSSKLDAPLGVIGLIIAGLLAVGLSGGRTR